MAHLVVNPFRRHECPYNVIWFIEGFLGIRFAVNADGTIVLDYGLGGIPGWRAQAKIISAEGIAKQLNVVADNLSLSGLIDYWLGVNYVRWADDAPTEYIDHQPDDYINASGIVLSEERDVT